MMFCKYERLARIMAKLSARLSSIAVNAPPDAIDRVAGVSLEAVSDSYATGVTDERAWVLSLLDAIRVISVEPSATALKACEDLCSMIRQCVHLHALPQHLPLANSVGNSEDKANN